MHKHPKNAPIRKITIDRLLKYPIHVLNLSTLPGLSPLEARGREGSKHFCYFPAARLEVCHQRHCGQRCRRRRERGAGVVAPRNFKGLSGFGTSCSHWWSARYTHENNVALIALCCRHQDWEIVWIPCLQPCQR